MRVLVVGEGPHELGDEDEPGALIALVRRFLRDDDVVETDRVSRSDLGRLHGKGNGQFKRAVRWMLEAEKRGFDALVYVIDEDGDVERHGALADAQSCSVSAIRRALGVAIRTFDAWILADEGALSEALERTVATQSDPEAQSDPKARCFSLLIDEPTSMSQRTMYARVAARVDLDLLEERCPRGFGTFATRLRSLQQ